MLAHVRATADVHFQLQRVVATSTAAGVHLRAVAESSVELLALVESRDGR